VRENKEIRVQCYFVFLVNFILAVTKGLRDQILSKYTHPFFLSPYPFSLSPQIISLDISQRSIFVPPAAFRLISSNWTDTFYFPGILYQLVPESLKSLAAVGKIGDEGKVVGWT